MTPLLFAAALFILLTLLVSLFRVIRGPEAVDRMLGVQVFGTAGTAILVLLSEALALEGILDAALALAMLTAVSIITFTQAYRLRTDNDEEESS
ncbi:MAG: monovalent cation/H+ antiporter complex subunit F [Verrucomicrobia bacterium]|nr:monovalent cation/H+ antiporter complex subunit F [Verrucomicrobiota bacterium]